MVSKVYQIALKSFNNPNKQKINVELFRNDFMIDRFKKQTFQVEFNLQAIGASSHSDKAVEFIRYLYDKYPHLYSKYSNCGEILLNDDKNTPGMCYAMFQALTLAFPEVYTKCIIVLITLVEEKNIFCQYSIINMLWEK